MTDPVKEDPKYPEVRIVIYPDKGITVELKNWTGVSMITMEKMYHEIIKAVQRHQATSLQKMRQQEQLDKLLEETENAAR